MRCASTLNLGERTSELMKQLQARFVGVERYFEDSAAAKNFYVKTLGLAVADQQTGHYAKFQAGGSLRLPGTKRD